MKILIVSQYYYPEQFQINEIAPELVRRGHEVTVLCGLPNYPQGKIYPEYKDKSKRNEILEGVRIIRANQIARGYNPLTLVLNYWSFAKQASKLAKSLPPDFDIVLGYQLSPVTSMLPAIAYKKKYGTPSLMYCLDLWPVSGQSHLPSPIKNGLIYKWLTRMSKDIYNSFDKIMVTSKPFIKYLHRTNGVAIERMGYIPQHADSSMTGMNLSNGPGDVINFMYAGNLGAGATLDVILKAAKILGPRKDYKIHFVGSGSKLAELKKMTADLGLQDNVVFHGNQRREDMPKFYRITDILLITLRGNNAVGDTMPGKLQMYMTAGKPILGAINGAANEVITESGCGKCVTSGDFQGLAALMRHCIDAPEDFRDCGKKAREYFLKNFTFGKYMDALEAELNSLIKR